MKKIAFLASMLCIALSISAQTVTGTAVLKIYSENSGTKSLTLIQAEEFSDAYDASYDAEAQGDGGLYVLSGGTHYSIWASNALSANLPLGFGTCDDLAYALKFDNASFSGTTFTIYDKVADQLITVNGSNSDYAFTIAEADKNKAIEDRFVINYVAAAPSICFNYGILEINGHAGESLVVKTKEGATELVNVPALPAAYSVNIDEKVAKDTYVVVTLNGQDYQIKANPTVTPAN